MARIPVYEQRAIIGAGDMPTARASANVSASDPVAEGLQRIGQQGMAIANQIQTEQIKKQEDTAAVDVANVLSQADVYWQQKITEATKAWTVGGPDLRETLGKEFDTWQTDTATKLGTDKARQYFNQHAAGMKSKMQTGVYSYQERATTAKLNADSAAGEQADENVVYNEPTRAEEIYRRRMETVIARNDLTEAEKIAAADKFKRKLAYSAERGQLDRDPEGWYRQRFGDFRKPVQPPAPAQVGDATGTSGAGAAVPADLWAAQIGQESGGKQFGSDGKPLTSKKGAIGVAQVMPGTAPEAAKLAGLPWDERRYQQDAGYNEKLGQAYMAKQLETFGGDTAKALAAYNMGPGSEAKGNGVKGLVAKYGDNWLQHAPAETRDYVKKIMGRLNTGTQTASAPTGTVSDAGNGMPAVTTPPAPIQQPATFTTMDWEQQAALKQHAETRLKQLESTFRAEADRAVADAVAMHKDGIVDPNELTPDFFNRAYGADGARLYKDYVASRDMGGDIGRFKTQSEAEIQAEIQRDAPVAGEGYANADARRNVRVQAAQHVLQARKADPAGYVASTNDSLRAQRQAIDNPQTPADQRPAMVQRYVRESLAEQTRLGIQNPAILTPGQSDAIAKRAMAAQKPEDSANLIAGLEAEYGQFFPKVFGELVRDKKISGELLLIPNLPSQTAREAVSRLARVKESDLTQGLDNDQQKKVKEEVTAKLAEFVKAVPMMTEQASGVVNSYESSMRKLAYQFILSGQDPTTATDTAHAMLLGHYQFDGTMRVPKGVNMRDTKRGADFMLKNDLSTIDVPPDLVGARKPEEARTEWQSTVQSRAMWFTSDDDKGLALYAMGQNGVRYRVTRGGKPVVYSWPDLAGRVAIGSGRVSSGKITDMTGGR